MLQAVNLKVLLFKCIWYFNPSQTLFHKNLEHLEKSNIDLSAHIFPSSVLKIDTLLVECWSRFSLQWSTSENPISQGWDEEIGNVIEYEWFAFITEKNNTVHSNGT